MRCFSILHTDVKLHLCFSGLHMSKLNLGFHLHLHPTTWFLKNFLRNDAGVHRKLFCWCFLGRFRVFFLCYRFSFKYKANKLHGTELEKFCTNEKTLSILAVTLIKIFNFAREDVYKLIHKAWRRDKNEPQFQGLDPELFNTTGNTLIHFNRFIKTKYMAKKHQ